MRFIDRYIGGILFQAFFMIMGTLIGVFWLLQVVGRLNLVVAEGRALWQFLKLTVMALPTPLLVLIPVAAYLAAMYALDRLSRDSELIAVTAGGTSRTQLLPSFLALAGVAALLTALMSIVAMPAARYESRTTIANMRADVISSVVQEGRFTQIGQLTFHIRERTPDGALEGVLISDERNPDEKLTYIAERGFVVRDGDVAFFALQNGSIQRDTGRPSLISFVTFETYAFDLSEFRRPGAAVRRDPRTASTLDLLLPQTDSRDYWQDSETVWNELHRRLAPPLHPVALTLLTLALLGRATTTRQSRSTVLAVTSLFGFALIAVHAMLLIAIDRTPELAHALYLVPTGMIILSLALIASRVPRIEQGLAEQMARLPAFDARALARTGRELALALRRTIGGRMGQPS